MIRNIFRILLGLFLIFAGTGHLSFARYEFEAQVPSFVPMNADLVVLLSGVVEILMGLALIFVRKYRVQVGLFIALFFVLVFPGNIAQYVHHRDAFGLNTDTLRLIRLFFQPVLILWVLWATNVLRSPAGRSH
ncbi:DoxX family protein [Chitinophaga silvisoli]|uniref:DoxX family membrane protein n=1 Tax=Chitinophaga silvisoli TaxID=2291814 RepID=A0A3E1NYM3_9BACT|nr:DoxX family membrane protein [Chitinophaga silvisoli]RFM33023.1 DoxX family membrane protein [Chitinophaga silvisoli]